MFMRFSAAKVVALSLSFSGSAVFAHPGHSGSSSDAVHLFTSPSHLWPWVACAVVLLGLTLEYVRRQGKKTRLDGARGF